MMANLTTGAPTTSEKAFFIQSIMAAYGPTLNSLSSFLSVDPLRITFLTIDHAPNILYDSLCIKKILFVSFSSVGFTILM